MSPVKRLASERIIQEIRKFDPNVEVELVSDDKAVVRVDNDVIARLIGKEGVTIKALEDRLGIHIDAVPKTGTVGKEEFRKKKF